MAKVTDQEKVKEEITGTVTEILQEEMSLAELEKQLQESPQFKAFIEAQRTFQTRSALFWKTVEGQMINNEIKSIKGDWGSLTIVERTNLKAADLSLVPSKFLKKVLDTTQVSAYEKLTGKLPKGVESTPTKYLMKKFKTQGETE
jgi:hypothetical protein